MKHLQLKSLCNSFLPREREFSDCNRNAEGLINFIAEITVNIFLTVPNNSDMSRSGPPLFETCHFATFVSGLLEFMKRVKEISELFW